MLMMINDHDINCHGIIVLILPHPLLRYGILNPTAVRAAATSGKPGVKVFNHDYDDVGSDVDDNGDVDDNDDGDNNGDSFDSDDL